MPIRVPASDPSAHASPQQEITRIAGLRGVHSAFLYLHNQEMEFRRWQRELTEIPAPPFGEAARSEWSRDGFISVGLQEVATDEVGNVCGLLEKEGKHAL